MDKQLNHPLAYFLPKVAEWEDVEGFSDIWVPHTANSPPPTDWRFCVRHRTLASVQFKHWRHPTPKNPSWVETTLASVRFKHCRRQSVGGGEFAVGFTAPLARICVFSSSLTTSSVQATFIFLIYLRYLPKCLFDFHACPTFFYHFLCTVSFGLISFRMKLINFNFLKKYIKMPKKSRISYKHKNPIKTSEDISNFETWIKKINIPWTLLSSSQPSFQIIWARSKRKIFYKIKRVSSRNDLRPWAAAGETISL